MTNAEKRKEAKRKLLEAKTIIEIAATEANNAKNVKVAIMAAKTAAWAEIEIYRNFSIFEAILFHKEKTNSKKIWEEYKELRSIATQASNAADDARKAVRDIIHNEIENA